MARRANLSGANTRRMGRKGTYIGAGVISGVEANTKLRADLARGTPSKPGEYLKMATQEPQVASMLRSSTGLLLSASGTGIYPPDGADDNEIRIAEATNDAFERMDGGPGKFLRAALTFLREGFALFEDVHVKHDRGVESGVYGWKEFAPRLQPTVFRWHVDDEADDLAAVEFDAPRGTSNGAYERYTLDARWLTHLALDQEGNNFEGFSLLRAAYTPWLIKRAALRGLSIDVERLGSGFLHFEQTIDSGGVNENDYDQFAEIATNWRTNIDAFAVTPYGWNLNIVFPDIPVTDRVDGLLRYLDQQIAKCFLGTFLELGLDKAGTQALGSTLFGNFVLGITSFGRVIEEALNGPGGTSVNGAIAKLVDMNWGPQERYPQFRFGRIDPGEAAATLKAISEAAQSGVLGSLTAADVNTVRGLTPLGPLTEDQEDEVDDEPDGAEEPEPEAPTDGETPPAEMADSDIDADAPEDDPQAMAVRPGSGAWITDAEGQGRMCRRSLYAQEAVVAFGAIERAFDSGTEGYEAAVKPALEAGKGTMARELGRILLSSDTPEAKVDAVAGLGFTPKARAAVETAIADHLAGLADAARDTAAAEVSRQVQGRSSAAVRAVGDTPGRPVPIPDDVQPSNAEIARAQAKVAAQRAVSETEQAIREAGVRAVQAGPGASQAIADANAAVGGLAASTYRRLAGSAVGATIGRAREAGAIENLQASGMTHVEEVLYSSVLDDDTCGPCQGLDGTTYPYGSAEYWSNKPPYQGCDGRTRCRCIHIILGMALPDA